MTTAAPPLKRDAAEWEYDPTTTMTDQPRWPLGARTAEPVRKDAARVRAVRVAGERQYFAWSRINELCSGTRITIGYDLEIDIGDDKIVLLGNVADVVSTPSGDPQMRLLVVSYHSAEPMPSARTPLGRRLMDIRRKIVASGQPLLNWDGLEREVEARRARRLPGDES